MLGVFSKGVSKEMAVTRKCVRIVRHTDVKSRFIDIRAPLSNINKTIAELNRRN